MKKLEPLPQLSDAPEMPDTFSDSKTIHFADHEFYLAFNGDEDCERFNDWLNTEGWKAFQKYWYKREKYLVQSLRATMKEE